MQLRDYIESIGVSKKNIIRGNEISRSAAEKAYSPYAISKVFSYHQDCILFVNEINTMPMISPIQHYEFLLHTLRAYKRPFIQMVKSVEDEDLFVDRLMSYYNCSRKKAHDVGLLYTEAQKKEFMSKFETGGM